MEDWNVGGGRWWTVRQAEAEVEAESHQLAEEISSRGVRGPEGEAPSAGVLRLGACARVHSARVGSGSGAQTLGRSVGGSLGLRGRESLAQP